MNDSFMNKIIFRPAIESDIPILAMIYRNAVLDIENTQ